MKNSAFKGTIESWEYNHGIGWSPASLKSARIPFNVSFTDSVAYIEPIRFKEYLDKENLMKVDASLIYDQFPEFKYYLPDEIDSLRRDLLVNFNIKITLNEYGHVSEMGKIIKGK
jgi:hypothetical protein